MSPEDRPRPRFRENDRRERKRYDDEPVKKKPSALPLLLVAGGGLALLLLVGVAAVAMVFMSSPPVAQNTAPVLPTQTEPTVPRGGWNDANPDPFFEPKKPEEPKVEEPKVEEPKREVPFPEPKRPEPPPKVPDFPRPNPFIPPNRGPNPFNPPVQPEQPKVENPRPVFPRPEPPKPEAPKPVKRPVKYADVVGVEIKPAKLAEKRVEVKLPGKMADLCVGGGGRFLILHLADEKQLAVFDVSEAKVVKQLPLDAGEVKFAAGMNKLIVAYPQTSKLVRYDLGTFEKEDTQAVLLPGHIRQLSMGSASAGPLLVFCETKVLPRGTCSYVFFDPGTLAEVDVAPGEGFKLDSPALRFQASPDGTLFGAWDEGFNRWMAYVVQVNGGTQKRFVNSQSSTGHVIPAADGRVYTGTGVFTTELKRVDNTHHFFVPADEGPHHLRVLTPDGKQALIPGLGGAPGRGVVLTAEMRAVGEARPLATFTDLGPFPDNFGNTGSLTSDKRFHLVCAAELLVTIPDTNDRLVLDRFDLEAPLKARGGDYLFVASRPPTAVPGKEYEYTLAVKSNKGGVKFKLNTGPNGMAISADGKLTWQVPADFAAPVAVAVTVSDASRQEVVHAFDLAPGNGKRLLDPVAGVKPIPGDAKGAIVLAPEKVFEMKPPPLYQKTAISLPAVADAVCVGGGGRFLIYRLPSRKELAILDVTVGRIVKQLPLDEPDALFAAGMTKLFVFNKTAGMLVRYDLETFEKEVTAPNPVANVPTLMVMGHSSNGPLYLGGRGERANSQWYGFVHTHTLKEVTIPIDGPRKDGKPPTGPVDGAATGYAGVTVSPDGRTYCWCEVSGTKLMTIGDRVATVGGEQGAFGDRRQGLLKPGPDGSLFGRVGVYTAELKRIVEEANGNSRTSAFIPATSGPWFVTVSGLDKFDQDRGGRKIYVGTTGDERVRFPILALDGLPSADVDPFSPKLSQFPLSTRVHLMPAAEVLAILDDNMDKVHLHRVPIRKLVERSGDEYLVTASVPPPAVRGQKWAYTPEVWSKVGGVKVAVDNGPAGMKANGGTVTWDVPADATNVTVILNVSDASGKEVFHSFTLSARGELPPAPAVIKLAPPPAPPAKPVADPSPAFVLKPTAAKDGTDLELSGPADSVCLAGGGRFILLRIPSKKEVAVFDTVAAKVVKQLPLPEDGSLVAGGAEHAFVINPAAGLVQRWNLSTFEKEGSTKLPDKLSPKLALMGHASNGPLFLAVAGDGTDKSGHKNAFYDPFTLQRLEYKRGKGSASGAISSIVPVLAGQQRDTLCCSPDGRVWGAWNKHSSPTGIYSWVLDGPIATLHASNMSAGPVAVGPGGILFSGAGVATGDHSRVLDATLKGFQDQGKGAIGKLWLDWREGQVPIARTPIPATEGPLYLWFPPPKTLKPDEKPEPPALKMIGASEPLATLKDLRGVFDPDLIGRGARELSADGKVQLFAHQRSFLIPAAGLLAVLSLDGTKLHLHAINFRDLLDKSGKDYLLVSGCPPQSAPRGKTWTHTLDVWSKKGGVKVEAVDPPTGLKVDGTAITWDVPATLIDQRVTLELKVTDASDRKLTYTLPLALDATATPTAPTTTGESGNVPPIDRPVPVRPRDPDPKIPVAPVPGTTKPPPNPELAVKDGLPQAGEKAVPGVKATKAKDGTDVALPAAADAACLAGGGRHLLLRIPSKKLVAVFDTLEAKVVKELPLHEDGALVAGSRAYAFVVYPKSGVVQRWRLEGFEHEATVKLPDGFAPTAAVMGHSGEGPLVLGVSKTEAAITAHNGFYDPITLKQFHVRSAEPGKLYSLPQVWLAPLLSISPDGRTFGWGAPPPVPGGIFSLVLDGTTVKYTKSDGFGGLVRVGAEGNLFTATGVFTGDQATILDAHSPKVTAGEKGIATPSPNPGKPPEGLSRGAVPAADGPFYLWFPEMKFEGGLPRMDSTPALKAVGVKEPLADLNTARGMTDRSGGPASLVVQHRAFLIPSADLMAVLSPDGTKLHLHVIKFRELLDKGGQDYLFVTGRPQQYLANNVMWLYTPDVWSKKGEVKVELVKGPDGMKVVDGAVMWSVPPKWTTARTPVELKISDASGKSVTQTFDLLHPSTAPAVPPPPPPPPRQPGRSATAAHFDYAWEQYLKRTKLEPATFKGESAAIPLDDAPASAVVGGGGRYLAIPLPAKKLLKVVDLSTAEVTFELPFDAKTDVAAANRSHLFVRSGTGKTVTRYDSATGKQVTSAKSDWGGEPGRLIAAADSDNAPLLLAVSSPTSAVVAISPETLGELPNMLNLPAKIKADSVPFSISPDGQRILLPSDKSDWDGAFYLGTRGGSRFSWELTATSEVLGRKLPRQFQVTGTGAVFNNFAAISPDNRHLLPIREEKDRTIWHLPACGPLFAVAVPRKETIVQAITSGPDQPRLVPTAGGTPDGMWLGHLCEPLGVITHFDAKTKNLIVRKFDLKKLYSDASNPDPLIVLAPPPAERGKEFTCVPAVLARGQRRPTLTLDEGPKGMKLYASGKLEWAVPTDFAEPFVAVTVTATADDGKKSSLTVFPAVTGERK